MDGGGSTCHGDDDDDAMHCTVLDTVIVVVSFLWNCSKRKSHVVCSVQFISLSHPQNWSAKPSSMENANIENSCAKSLMHFGFVSGRIVHSESFSPISTSVSFALLSAEIRCTSQWLLRVLYFLPSLILSVYFFNLFKMLFCWTTLRGIYHSTLFALLTRWKMARNVYVLKCKFLSAIIQHFSSSNAADKISR